MNERGRQPLLSAQGLTKAYRSKARLLWRPSRVVHALNGVGLEVFPRSTIGIVGESGCGKSTLARCLAGLDQPDSGAIVLELELLRAKQRVQLIQQDSISALNPWLAVEELISEPLRITKVPPAVRRVRVRAAMQDTGISEAFSRRRPHELSGGQRQRVAIARALCVEPKILILDETLSGLDLPAQRELHTLLRDLQNSRGMGCVFISHDLRLVAHCSNEIAVMEDGRIVEQGSSDGIFGSPKHSCTRRLIDAIPSWEGTEGLRD